MAAASASLLERSLLGQEGVQAFLRNALDENRVSHAYLFLGAPGSGKLDAAYALAQGVVCPNGGCGPATTASAPPDAPIPTSIF